MDDKTKAKIVKEYLSAGPGEKAEVAKKYGVHPAQLSHWAEEAELGAERKRWRDYTPAKQEKIVKEYLKAPRGQKREAAHRYGLLTRDVASPASRLARTGTLKQTKSPPVSNGVVETLKEEGRADPIVDRVLELLYHRELTPQAAKKLLK